jgi:hypothetical protein
MWALRDDDQVVSIIKVNHLGDVLLEAAIQIKVVLNG